MQKKLIALALASMATGAAFAQSNVTIYGRVDYGFENRGGNSGGVSGVENKNEFASGIQAGSRIGFKGAEDLGNGLKAIFETEFGIANDQTAAGTTSATWTNRHSYVGLTGGFGTVVGGRLDGVRYGIFNQYDPFAGGTVGNFTQMTAQVDRADNAVAYISPSFSGFGVLLAYATNIAGPEKAGNNGDSRLNTIMGTYDNGPISARLDYEQIKTDGMSGKLYVTTVAGSYDFGMVKLSALYDILKSDIGGPTSADFRNWFIGAKAPIGKFTVKANFGRTDNRLVSDADADKWGIGVDYSLSKRTTVYADYGKIHNDSAALYTLSPSPNAQGVGYGVRGVDIGIAHNF